MDTIFNLSDENPVEVGRLTTDHAASSYGQPVLVCDGEAYGPADVLPFPEGMEFLRYTAGEWITQRVYKRQVRSCTCGSEHRLIPFLIDGHPSHPDYDTGMKRCTGCGAFDPPGPGGCYRVYCALCAAAIAWAKPGFYRCHSRVLG